MSVGPEITRPLIRYAGSAAETSIGSKPIGSELIPKSTCLLTFVKNGRHANRPVFFREWMEHEHAHQIQPPPAPP